MSWFAAVPAILTALLVLLLPGALLGWFLSLRGFTLVATAPLFSVSLVAVAGVADPLLHLPWSAWTVLGLAILGAAVVWVVRRPLARRWPEAPPPPLRSGWALAGTAIAAVLIGADLLYAFGAPDHISQTFDNIFHLNAVRYIEDTGQASSLTVGGMTGIPFYPAAWHAVVSLVAELGAVSIPVAVNATNLVIGAVVWPLGCIFLSRSVLGNRPAVAMSAGVLSASFGAFPMLMVSFGVLYPNLLAIALLPSLLAVGAQLLGLSVTRDLSLPATGLALLLALPGITLAHPSTTMAALAFLAPAAVLVYLRELAGWRRHWPERRRAAAAWTSGAVIALVVAVVAWKYVRPSNAAAFWQPVQTAPRAALQILTNSPLGTSPAIVASVLAVAGLVLLLRSQRTWWVVAMFAVSAFLFGMVSSFHFGRLRTLLTGIWYNDSYRLAALLPTAMIVPATAAAVWIWRLVSARLAERQLRRTTATTDASAPAPTARGGLATTAAAVVVVLVLAASTQLVGSVPDQAAAARADYELDASSPLLTADEHAVLGDLDALVPEGAVIAANPGNGSALAYALADRRTIQLHILTSNLSADDKLLLAKLRDARTDPAVCPAVKRLGVGYVLDFGTQEVNDEHHPAPGLANLENSGAATLLDRHGEAKLFKISACG